MPEVTIHPQNSSGSEVEIPYFLQNTEELIIPEESKAIGEIPSFLQESCLIVIGPGLFDLPKGSFKNWLDGMPLIAKFEIGKSTIKMKNRFVQSQAYKSAVKKSAPMSIEFGTNPRLNKGMLAKLKPFTPNDVSDSCLGNMMLLEGKHPYLVSDSVHYFKINLETLETMEKLNTINSFSLSSLSYFPYDNPKTGEWYTMGTSHITSGMIKYQILTKKSVNKDRDEPKLEVLCSIPSRWYSCLSMLRCFGVTENYIIFVEQPAVLSVMKLATTHLKGYSSKDWLEWKENELNRFYVVEKSTGKIIMGQKFEVYSEEPFMSLWVINAFEEDNNVVMDIVSMENPEFLHKLELQNIRKMHNAESALSVIKRFRIPIIKKLAELDKVSKSPLAYKSRDGDGALFLRYELPLEKISGFDYGVINKLFLSQKYSYFYCTPSIHSMNTSDYFGKLCKVNVNTGEVVTWEPENSRDPKTGRLRYGLSNSVFVPTPQTNEKNIFDEDEGVLLTSCLTTCKQDKNFLVILDAKTMKETTRVYFENKIPAYLYASFMQ